MRPSLIACALLVACAIPIHGADKAVEDSLRKGVDTFLAAWNKDDAKAMAAIWAEDGTLINPMGRVAKGRNEIEKLFADEHAAMFKGSTASAAQTMVKQIGPDVTVADYDFTITTADGVKHPTDHVIIVAVKKGDGWAWSDCRAFEPMKMPEGKAAPAK